MATIKELLTLHEGRKNKPYKCPAGKNTIGVGRNFDDNPLPPDIADYLKKNGQITDEMIDQLLETDIRHVTADCKVLFPSWDSFSPARQMAFIDFVFNVGFGGARKFVHMIAVANTGRWDDVVKELKDSRWAGQVPNRAKDLISMIEDG